MILSALTFEYPMWFVGFCALAGILYSGFLYFRDDSFKEQNSWWKRLMAALRFLSVSLLAFLLLSPVLQSSVTDSKKPIIVLAADNSESMRLGMNTADTAQFRQALTNLAAKLAEKYEVYRYNFGEEVRDGFQLNYKDKTSDIAQFITEMYDQYSGQNIGAVVLATDGIYNRGANPVYTAAKLPVSFYTVAIGDTVPKRDVVVKRVNHNQIAYLGDQFSIQADITAANAQGNAVTLSVARISGKAESRLQSKTININSDDFFFSQELILNADAAGIQRYRVTVSSVQGEVTTVNNVKDIVIEVIDSRQKVLLLANAPHPDLSALKQTITSNKNYDVTIDYVNEIKTNIEDYDLLILHQIPGTSGSIPGLEKTKKPRLFILGNQTNLSQLAQLQDLVRVTGASASANEVQASLAPAFDLFNLKTTTTQQIPKYPPLTAPFGDYQTDARAKVLLYQKIGSVATKYPLLAIGETEKGKLAVLSGEGIWKWRLQDYTQNKNFDNFNELITNTIQFLTLKEDKRKFRAFVNKTLFNENENIIIDAELYNDSYQRINTPDATVIITNESGKDYPYTFTKTPTAYTINTGLLPVGDYTYKASTNYNGKTLTASGNFSVKSLQLEAYETTADHTLLRSLARQSGGAFVYPKNIAGIADQIEARGSVKPVLYSSLRAFSLINLKWIFGLLLLWLSAEWFLRKFLGGY